MTTLQYNLYSCKITVREQYRHMGIFDSCYYKIKIFKNLILSKQAADKDLVWSIRKLNLSMHF